MIDRARVVVVGGGIAGVSTLYHLTRLGWDDVALVEANELTSGSTWHAAGLCTQFIQSYNLMTLLRRSLDLYDVLPEETGVDVGLHRCGSVRIATTEDRLHQFEQVLGIAENVGVPMEIVSPERAAELFPLATTDGVLAAAHLPTDGHVDPSGLTSSLARGALDRGATIERHTRVTALQRERGGWMVSTTNGEIAAQHVVIAAGQWSRQVARLAGVELPIVPLQHHYVVTEPLPELEGLAQELPVFRDPDNSFYARQEGGGLLVGPFERDPKTWALDGVPDDFHGKLLPPDLEQIESVPRRGGGADPGVRRGRPQDGDQRARRLHARRQLPDGAGARAARAPRARGLLHLRDRLRRRGGRVCRGVDRRGPAERQHVGARRAPLRRLRALDLVRRRARVRGLRARVRDPLPRGGAPGRPPAAHRPALRPAAREGGRDRRPLGLGAPALVRARRRGARRLRLRPRQLARGGRRGVPRRPERRRRPRPDELREVRGRRARAPRRSSTGLCANRLPVRARPDLPDADPHRARRDRGRRHGRARRAGSLLRRLRRGHRDARPRLDRSGTCPRTARCASRTSPSRRRADARRPALARAAAAPDARRPLARGVPVLPLPRARARQARVLALRVSYVGELGFELHHPLECSATSTTRSGRRARTSASSTSATARSSRCASRSATGSGAPTSRPTGRRSRRGSTGSSPGTRATSSAARRSSASARRGRRTCSRASSVDADGADAHGYEPVYAGGERPVAYVSSGGYGHVVERSIALAYLPVAHAAVGTELEVGILGERRRAVVAEQPLYDPLNERLRS